MDAVTDIMNEVLVSFENREPSGFDMPMMKFEHMMGANVAYVVGILLLKKIMSSDSIPAMDLKWFRAVYNLACVVLSAWSLYLAVVAAEAVGVFNGTWVCTQGTPEQMVVVHNCLYIFYVSKFFEYTDTVIMCLRKKFRQVSFLHVYHHASVSMVVWTYLAYKSGGDEYLAAGLNSFIHVLMYSHYFVTTFGMSTPWKQWLTKLQLLQFCCVFAQSAIAVKGRCGWPEWMKWQQLMYMTTMLVLFGNFFIQSYVVKKPKKKSE
eukprot:TRINITY_DN3469_c0_g4_i1.p2 TRINITY_DN3469_c0_g4~~TRINITY_DN3469_c0_g4_i1.p2  ORF type:complete len:263 (+),score=119.15 TRINITY_DN3469_c0_g4_i1:55-843(+)